MDSSSHWAVGKREGWWVGQPRHQTWQHPDLPLPTVPHQILYQRLDSTKWTKNKHIPTDSIIGCHELSVISQLSNIYIKNKMSHRTILHMMTVHCGLNKHLQTIKRSHTKMCPNCEESKETVEYFKDDAQPQPSSEETPTSTITTWPQGICSRDIPSLPSPCSSDSPTA